MGNFYTQYTAKANQEIIGNLDFCFWWGYLFIYYLLVYIFWKDVVDEQIFLFWN